MPGQIEERPPGSKTWRLRVYVGRGPNGSPRFESRTVHGSRRQAEKALAVLVAEVERRRRRLRVAPEERSVGTLLDRWLEHSAQRGRKRSTLDGYRKKVDGLICPALGSTRLEHLDVEAVDAAYTAWLAQGLSPTTVRHCHAILRAAFRQGERWGWVWASPVERATPPPMRRAEPTAPSAAEMRAILAAMAGEPQRPVLATAVLLAAATGARRGELCALRWSDLDVDGERLRIGASLTALGREWTLDTPKTGRPRVISLDPVTVALLGRRREGQEAAAKEMSVSLCDDPFILSRSLRGEHPCLPDGLTHGFRRVCESLGLPYHFHQLRHAHATLAIAAGVDPRTVASRLGHADPSVTLRVYSAQLPARDREVALLLARALGAGGEE